MSRADGSLSERKAALRREVAARIGRLSPRELAERGRQACQRLAGAEDFRRAGSFLLYAALPDEIDTSPLIDELLAGGKAVFLPVCRAKGNDMDAVRITDRERDLIEGRFGIPEPRPGLPAGEPSELDFVLVPGRAFDRRGRRLGRGRGFYDRFLESSAGQGCFAASVALDLQVFPEVPAGERDLPVELIATESELLRGSRE